MNTPKKTAIVGALFALPFFLANFVVALRFEPFYSLLGIIPAMRKTPILPLLLLLLFPIGAYIAIRPSIQKKSGKRKFYIANTFIAAFLLVFFFIVFTALGEEFYRCDILHIPNCD
jgi:hypothetical protein